MKLIAEEGLGFLAEKGSDTCIRTMQAMVHGANGIGYVVRIYSTYIVRV